jgi:hypothetical protein
MPAVITHRGTRIVTLQQGEGITEHCTSGDIAIVEDEKGWWTHFVGENGEIEGYDAPFDNYNKALWTAKAAAEFAAE